MSAAESPQSTPGSILPLQYLKGVGPKRAEVLAQEGIKTALDLLLYVPHSYIDRNSVSTLARLRQRLSGGQFNTFQSSDEIDALRTEITVVARVQSIQERVFGRGRKMLVVQLVDDSRATADIVFWSYTDYYKKTLKQDQLYAVSGKAELNRFGRVTFNHPEIEAIEGDDEELYRQGRILPKYRISQAMKNVGLSIRAMRLLVEQALHNERVEAEECLADYILRDHQFPSKNEALHSLHFPQSLEQLHAARARMKFEELFFFELVLAFRYAGNSSRDTAPKIAPPSPSARKVLERLPFQLTTAQKRVVWEIVNDMEKDTAMNRLLQGDVGSGKTIVALLSMLMAVDAGYQSVLLAPTEILAEQHYQGIKRYCEELDIDIIQVVGGQTKKARLDIAERMQRSKACIIVGTHALFGGSAKRAKVEVKLPYARVGLIVIDEQHRFGVLQRAKLREMGMRSFPEDQTRAPHILVMSATPIPRTLSMTAYGDLDVSVIDELPPSRQHVETRIVFESGLSQQYEWIKSELRAGRQAYIVYPLVEESEKLELKAATQAFEELKTVVFPDFRCGLLHGQMLWYEKEEAMQAFQRREFDILISTTVIEVGIDVPNATVMLIQNAERFGLSQLHQLRGRVGRGAHRSYCFLATKDHFAFQLRRKDVEQQEKLSAVVRLRTMEQTNDGFKIAEVDLRLRGPGDVLGTRQSGIPNFRFADLVEDGSIVQSARTLAFSVVEKDPQLRRAEHESMRREFQRQAREARFADTA